ncbi:MAG: EndoU domain-containing protein [Micromonosporaceae bacterium]
MPAASGWAASPAAVHPQRPSLPSIRLTDERRRHVFDGDTSGGGHRHGTGVAGKTEFPARWTDEATTVFIHSVARNPDLVEAMQFNGRWRVSGVRDGVTVVVVLKPDGQIWSAWPRPGGRGVVSNPKGT